MTETPTTPAALADLERLSAAATPGPWKALSVRNQWFIRAPRLDSSHPYDIEVLGDDTHSALYPEELKRADVEFIPAIVNAYRSGDLVPRTPPAAAVTDAEVQDAWKAYASRAGSMRSALEHFAASRAGLLARPSPARPAADAGVTEAVVSDAFMAQEWQSILEWDDRTSPEEYPEHILIDFNELRNFANSAVAAALSARGQEASPERVGDGWQPIGVRPLPLDRETVHLGGPGWICDAWREGSEWYCRLGRLADLTEKQPTHWHRMTERPSPPSAPPPSAPAAPPAADDVEGLIGRLREGLEPFAKAWNAYGDKPDDQTTINDNSGKAYLEGTLICFGDLRRAAALLRNGEDRS